MQTTVYRIETEQKDGPYSSLGYMAIHGHDVDEYKHPIPSRDIPCFEPWDHREMLYGFHSVRLLVRWFSRADRKSLAASGYRLSVYKVSGDRIVKGGRQCVFNPADAELTRVVPLAHVAAEACQ